MGKNLLLLLVVAVIGPKFNECRVACLWAGYDSGDYIEQQGQKLCRCHDMKDYEMMTGTKRLPLRRSSRGPLSKEEE